MRFTWTDFGNLFGGLELGKLPEPFTWAKLGNRLEGLGLEKLPELFA